MHEELKIYIDSVADIEQKLSQIGAEFIKEVEIKDTYFDQPGMVLKVTETGDQALLTQLQAQDGGFKFIKEEILHDVKSTVAELEKRYGVLCVLNKRKKFWKYGDFDINLNLFDDIGNFLIVEGASVQPEFFTETLMIKSPRYLEKSFAQLKLEQ